MRTLAAVLFALALPTAAQAQFMPQQDAGAGYRAQSMSGGSGNSRVNGRRPQDGYTTPEIHTPRTTGPVSAGSELGRARRDIERMRDRGELSRREAKALRKEADRIGEMADRYRRDGYSESELRELDLRTTELRNRTATGRTF